MTKIDNAGYKLRSSLSQFQYSLNLFLINQLLGSIYFCFYKKLTVTRSRNKIPVI
jgi:hypothetical protein